MSDLSREKPAPEPIPSQMEISGQLTVRTSWTEGAEVFVPAPLLSASVPLFALVLPLAWLPLELAPIFEPLDNVGSDSASPGVCPF
jgi:hypothetical protein